MYKVIYKAIEDINAARVGMLSPDIVEQDTATIEIRELFRVPKVGVIAGCYVTDGEVSRDDQLRIVRDGTIVYEGKMGSLRRFKEDVKSVKQGYECGIGIEGFQDIKEGDVLETFRTVEVAREA
ncbi:MAG: translation initiation factor IF-2, partial [Actinobacteria bacterium]